VSARDAVFEAFDFVHVLPEREVTAYSERMGDTLPPSGGGMPWKECHVMHERLRFVARRLEGEKMAPLCAEFGISRKTGYKISARVSRPRRAHLPVSRSDVLHRA